MHRHLSDVGDASGYTSNCIMRDFLFTIAVAAASLQVACGDSHLKRQAAPRLQPDLEHSQTGSLIRRYAPLEKRERLQDGDGELQRRGNCCGKSVSPSRPNSSGNGPVRQQYLPGGSDAQRDRNPQALGMTTLPRSGPRLPPRKKDIASQPSTSQEDKQPSLVRTQKITSLAKLPVRGLGAGLPIRLPVSPALDRESSKRYGLDTGSSMWSSTPRTPDSSHLLTVPKLSSLKAFANQRLPSFYNKVSGPLGRSTSFRQDGSHGRLNILDTRVVRLGSEPRLGGIRAGVIAEDALARNTFSPLQMPAPPKSTLTRIREPKFDYTTLSDSDESIDELRRTASI